MDREYHRYVAIGDSFTEGIGDPGRDGRDRGWADRVAERLAVDTPYFGYANLAIRGRLLGQIVAEQVPAAVALGPDLVSFSGGINDALRREWDLTGMAQQLDQGIGVLAGTGARVVIVTFGQPAARSRLMARVQTRLADYREVTYEIADRYAATVVDFWDQSVFNDPRFWSEDRLHLNSVGHERVSLAVLDALQHPAATTWWDPLPQVTPQPVWVRTGRHVSWAGHHLVPWLGRRMAGRSSGDGIQPKRTTCSPVNRSG